MKFLLFWIFCDNRLHTVYSDLEYVVPDYHWKDFDGIVPFGAVQGGIDEAGRWSYIGQAYIHGQGLIPVTIYEGTKTVCASTSSGAMVCIKDYIKVCINMYGRVICFRNQKRNNKPFWIGYDLLKILCAKDVKHLKWVRSKNEEVHLLSDCRLVEGGTQQGHVLYIGRVKHERETIIGKIYPNHLSFSGLYSPYNSSAEVKYATYKILTYNCNIPNLNVTKVNMKMKDEPDNQ